MGISKYNWDEIKENLSTLWGSAYLRCDDYLIAACVQQSKMKLVIVVYVNGFINGADGWRGKESQVSEMGDVAKRFHARKSIGRSAKEIKDNEKIFGKKACKEKRLNERYVYTLPYFSTAGAFINHIKKHNTKIEIMDCQAFKAAIAELRKDVVSKGDI